MTASPLTREDIEQIVEAIELFIIGGDDELDELWRLYIDNLEALLSDREPRAQVEHAGVLQQPDGERQHETTSTIATIIGDIPAAVINPWTAQ